MPLRNLIIYKKVIKLSQTPIIYANIIKSSNVQLAFAYTPFPGCVMWFFFCLRTLATFILNQAKSMLQGFEGNDTNR